jgi:hypothetical protein
MKRPGLVTLLACAVLILSALNGVRAAVGISRWGVFGAMPETFPSSAQIAIGVIWCAAWLVEAWGLWTLRSWARRAGIALFVLYQIVILGEQAIFTAAPYERGLLPVMAALSLLLIALVSLILTRQHVRRAFMSPHEESTSHG